MCTEYWSIISSPEPLGSQDELIVYPSSWRPSILRRNSLSNIAVLYICVICGFLEGLMEDWFHQMSNPRKIKNLLTYLLTYLLY